MGAVGSSADNAAAESFNAGFKRETLKGRKGWPDERQARLDAFRWLTRYNTRRRRLPPRAAVPDRLRERLPTNSNYSGPSRVDVFKVRGQGPVGTSPDDRTTTPPRLATICILARQCLKFTEKLRATI